MQDQYIHALIMYFAQGVGALILSLLLWKFYRVYKKPYLRSWAFSWIAFAIYLLGASISYINPIDLPIGHPARTIISTISLISGYFQMLWLVEGTYEVVYKRSLTGNIKKFTVVLILVASFVFTFSNASDPDGALTRLLLRVGFRALIAGICFGLSAMLLYRDKKNSGSLGVRMVFWSFLFYGFEQLHYFAAIIMGYFGNQILFSYTIYLGVFDLLLQLLMGVGKIVWLLEDERKGLKKTNKELDNLVYSTSHDLRAPLSSLLGLINIAKMETNVSKLPEYLQLMESRVKKLDDIITDIMVYSRNSKRQIKKELINFKELVSEVFEEYKYMDGAEKIKLIYSNGEDSLYSDANRLRVVLNNLISNSIKYHKKNQKNPFIKVEFHKNKKNYIIKVSDNGLGIDQSQKNKIFDMFYRASEKSNGSGLGLFIVKEALDQINGKIRVDSEINKGSTFTIELNK